MTAMSTPSRTLLLATAGALLPPVLAGCMTVHLHTTGAEPRVLRHVGWLQIEVPQAEAAVMGRLDGLGLVSTPMGASAGYTRQRWAALGPQCRAVLWVQDGTRLDEPMQRTLQQTAGVCLLDDGPMGPDRAERPRRRNEVSP